MDTNWINSIVESFEIIMKKVETGEININDTNRLKFIDENQKFLGKTELIRKRQLSLVKHINHYFTRVLQTDGDLEDYEEIAITSAIKMIINQLRSEM